MRRILPALVTALLVVTAGCSGLAGLSATGGDTIDDTQPSDDVAAQEEPRTGGDRTVTVSANGESAAAPDRAVVTVAVTAQGDDPASVRDDLSAGVERLRERLADAGVEEDQIRTVDYRMRQPHPREREEVGYAYEGRHVFEVSLDDPDAVGSVIDAAADANATVGDVRFTLSEDRRKELRDEALEDAMGDARRQAETVAATEELTVTDAAHIDASQRHYRPVRYNGAAPEMAAGDGGGTSVSTGDVSVSVQVQVTYNATKS